MSSRTPRTIAVLAIVVSLALVATACSDSSSSRRAGAAAGNPVELAALPASTGTGERVPVWTRADVTPTSWVSSSTVPTLVVPGATGAWTFRISDLSDGTSAFGTRTYTSNGASTRLPANLLENGTTYTWTAESPGQPSVGGSFTVDVQLRDVQTVDSVAGVDVLMASGEAAYTWASHSMAALGGSVGIGLRFQASNAPSPGVPAGWDLSTTSGSPYVAVRSRGDGSVGLVSNNGQVSSYRKGAGGSWNPVKMAGDGLDTSGTAPVLIENSDGSWSVTTKAATARFVDDNDDGTADLAGVSADDAPMLQQEWRAGLLRKITDPVSGRSIELVYGGGSCPKPASGFVTAPKDLLCAVKFWDGSTSAISYVTLPDGSVSIGRLTDFPEAGADGAQVSDVAYDAAGRIARTRSPLVAIAAASSVIGAEDTQFWAEVAYAPTGRVASITDAAPSSGAARCARTYDNEGALSAVTDSCLGKLVAAVAFDGTTFFPLKSTGVTGRSVTNTWDFATGNLLSTVDATGRITTNTFVDGNLAMTRGPSRDSATAQVAVREYDESYATAEAGTAMRGLDVVYWPSATERGADSVSELGPTLGGALASGLTVNWTSSPAGNSSGGWSALMNGSLWIESGGTYSFASNNSTARLRVANVACEDGGCAAIQLPGGPVAIRVEVTSTTPQASMDLTWSGPDTGGVSRSIPVSNLRPQYGYATETKIVDPTAVRSNVESISRSSYANPAKGLVTSRTNGAGSASVLSYEGAGWNRPTMSTLPAGNSVKQTWWGDRESATSPCPGAKGAVQGGAAKQTITPGPDGGEGPSAQRWYTASGAIAAVRLSDGVTQCFGYDRAGRLVSVDTIGLGETAKLAIDLAVDGDPLVMAVTETRGSTTTTSTTQIDLAGRTVRSVDRFGIVTTTTFDGRTGEVATSTSTPPGGAAFVTSYAYDEFGRATTKSIDGRVVATIGYGDLGLPTTVTYGNGAVTRFTFDAQDRAIGSTTSVAGHTYASSRVISGAGVVSSTTLTADDRSSTFDHTHDAAGRLSAIAVSPGLVGQARTWTYGYDANSNRVSQSTTVNGTDSGSYTYSYDRADRLVSTTDPAAKDGITYDARGNATKVGPDSFTYDGANLLLSATDGTSTVEYERAVDGSVIGKTTTTPTGSVTVRYGAGGLVLDDRNRPTAMVASLPGGAQLTKAIGASTEEWLVTTLSGDRFVTLDGAGARVGEIAVFTPFGEQIAGTSTIDGSAPDVTWKASEGNETIALRTTVVAMGQRVYVPALGRFVQVDPVAGGSANGYDYANQDPTSFTDPTGNADSSMDWLGMALVGVATVVGTLFIPASFGPKGAMVMGALFGVLAGTVNAVVQAVTGGDALMGIGSIAVGVLAGVASGGIAGKIKFARYSKATAARTGPGEPDSLVNCVLREVRYEKKYRLSGPGGASERVATRPATLRPQPAAAAKAPQAAPTSPPVAKPIEVKAPARQSTVRQSTVRSSTNSVESELNADLQMYADAMRRAGIAGWS